jgi:hypothetical protein
MKPVTQYLEKVRKLLLTLRQGEKLRPEAIEVT